MALRLDERLSFDTLFRASDPKRVARSFSVRGPPLEIDSYQDAVYYIFNFKASPSTTGLRHRGYVKFFKPKSGRQTPLQHVDCLVDCECPDYRYRWAWANKQRQSGVVGPQSLNQAWNKAPRKTNPKGKPGLCKHILAAREYIYGLLSSFPSDEPDTSEKLNKLTKHATKRWTNFPELMRQAKERSAEIKRRIAMRNVYGKVIEPEEVEKAVLEPPPLPRVPRPGAPAKPPRPPRPAKPKAPEQLKKLKPPALPSTMPYGPGGPPTQPIEVPEPPAEEAGPYGMTLPPPVPRSRGGPARRGPAAKIPRRRGVGDSIETTPKNFLVECVVRTANGEIMTSLLEAQKLVQELEDEQIALGSIDGGGAADDMGAGAEPLEPSEPPISDTAIGADTEGETALGLLRQMRDLLAELVTGLAPEQAGEEGIPGEGIPGEGGEMPPGGPEGAEGAEGEEGMPPIPPADDEIPTEGDTEKAEAGEEEEEEAEEKGEKKPRNRRPSEE